MSEWISVEERLPDWDTPVMAACKPYSNVGRLFVIAMKNPYIEMAEESKFVMLESHFGAYDFAVGEEHCGYNNDPDICDSITHWMPLPEPPDA